MSGNGPVGVGVIGAGTISEQYLPNMRAFPDLDVRVVADLRPDAAREPGGEVRRAGVGRASSGCSPTRSVELVVNLTVPAAHAEVAAAALAAGKHVWNEKPITADLAAGAALVARADAAGLLLGSAPDTFLGPGLQTVRRLIEAGAIGTPLTAAAVMQYAGPHRWHPNPDFLYLAGAGPLFDMGPYYLTALCQTFGAVRRVAARGATAGPTRIIGTGPRAGAEIAVAVPTYVAALYEFAGGGVAQATFSFDSPLRRTGMVEIAGTEATIVAPDPNRFGGTVVIERADAEPERDPGARGRGRARDRRRRHGPGDPGGRPPSRDGTARAPRAGRDARHRGVRRARRLRRASTAASSRCRRCRPAGTRRSGRSSGRAGRGRRRSTRSARARRRARRSWPASAGRPVRPLRRGSRRGGRARRGSRPRRPPPRSRRRARGVSAGAAAASSPNERRRSATWCGSVPIGWSSAAPARSLSVSG